jgi:hypothetical protein
MADSIPDAVLAPLSYAGAGDAASRLAKLHGEFSVVLQVPRVYVRHQGTSHFITGSPSDTLLFPKSDARSGRPRYDWSDRGDGVSFGQFHADP